MTPLLHRQRVVLGAVPVFMWILCAPAPASASSVLETVGAPGVGNGFSARVLSRDAEATYFNPALLPNAVSDISFGVLVLPSWERIHLDARPAGVDVPLSVYDADLVRAGGQRLWPQATARLLHARADTAESEVTPYAALGMARQLVGKGLMFGFYALLPTGGFLHQDGFFPDEREQYFSNRLHFELLGDRLHVTTLAGALGGRISPQLSWGIGVDVGMATRTHMQVYIPDAADESRLLMVPDIETQIAAAPYLGFAFRPWTKWLVTATLHTPKSWNTSGENRVRFWDYPYPGGETAVVQSYELTQGAEPMRIGLGLATSGQLGAAEWQLGAEGVLTYWSSYRDRHAERPLDRWNDTVNVGVGGTLVWAGRRLLVELGVAPSPVPDQTGQTNYVDATRWGASVGIELPFKYMAKDYALGLYLQGQLMASRSVTKSTDASYPVVDEVPDDAVDQLQGMPLPSATGLQTNNPGFPGYTSSAALFGASAVLKVMP